LKKTRARGRPSNKVPGRPTKTCMQCVVDRSCRHTWFQREPLDYELSNAAVSGGRLRAVVVQRRLKYRSNACMICNHAHGKFWLLSRSLTKSCYYGRISSVSEIQAGQF
jgi:hypothetical protein